MEKEKPKPDFNEYYMWPVVCVGTIDSFSCSVDCPYIATVVSMKHRPHGCATCRLFLRDLIRLPDYLEMYDPRYGTSEGHRGYVGEVLDYYRGKYITQNHPGFVRNPQCYKGTIGSLNNKRGTNTRTYISFVTEIKLADDNFFGSIGDKMVPMRCSDMCMWYTSAWEAHREKYTCKLYKSEDTSSLLRGYIEVEDDLPIRARLRCIECVREYTEKKVEI